MADKHPSVQRPDGVQQSIEAIGTVLIVSGVRGSAVSVSTGPSPSVLIIITAFEICNHSKELSCVFFMYFNLFPGGKIIGILTETAVTNRRRVIPGCVANPDTQTLCPSSRDLLPPLYPPPTLIPTIVTAT